MKKAIMILFLTTNILILGACGSNSKTTEKSGESSLASSAIDSSEAEIKEKQMLPSVFSGTLVEDAKVNGDESETVRLVLDNVEAIEDPEKIIGMMETEGVILNAPKKTFAKDLDEKKLLAEDKIQFTLEGLPIMTMSIPPQIPGNSIKLIEKIQK